MIDLTKITAEQANRIECALLILEHDVREQIEAHRFLANDSDLLPSTRKTMASNAKWWEEVHELIYGKEQEQ